MMVQGAANDGTANDGAVNVVRTLQMPEAG